MAYADQLTSLKGSLAAGNIDQATYEELRKQLAWSCV
jgi:hypothetical protein